MVKEGRPIPLNGLDGDLKGPYQVPGRLAAIVVQVHAGLNPHPGRIAGMVDREQLVAVYARMLVPTGHADTFNKPAWPHYRNVVAHITSPI